MEKLDSNKFDVYEEFLFLKRDDKGTIKKLKEGQFDDIQFSSETPVDDILHYGFDNDLLNRLLMTFPDPRKNFDVPINVVLLPQIIQRLNNETGQFSAPFLINDVSLVAKLGFNAKCLEEGFNKKNKKPRETIFHGEVLKHSKSSRSHVK